MARVKIDTTISGPFFSRSGVIMKEAGREWVRDMVREGEAKYKAQLYEGHGVRTGQYRRGVHGIVKDDVHGGIGNTGPGSGRTDRETAIIGNWLEGAKNRAAGTRFRGYHGWRKTRMHLTRLTREMGGKVYKRATKRMTGTAV